MFIQLTSCLKAGSLLLEDKGKPRVINQPIGTADRNLSPMEEGKMYFKQKINVIG